MAPYGTELIAVSSGPGLESVERSSVSQCLMNLFIFPAHGRPRTNWLASNVFIRSLEIISDDTRQSVLHQSCGKKAHLELSENNVLIPPFVMPIIAAKYAPLSIMAGANGRFTGEGHRVSVRSSYQQTLQHMSQAMQKGSGLCKLNSQTDMILHMDACSV